MKFLPQGHSLKSIAAAITLALVAGQPALASNEQVELIPEDTLFYFGTGKPVPVEDFFSLLPSAFNPEVMKTMLSRIDSNGGDEVIQKITDFLDDPTAFTNKWGLGDELQFSAYTVGLMPVFRIAGEGEKFEAAFAAATAESAHQFDVVNHNGIEVRIVPLEDEPSDATTSGPSPQELKLSKSSVEEVLSGYQTQNAEAQSALDAANASLEAAKEANDASGIAEAANQIAEAASTVAETTNKITEYEKVEAGIDTALSDLAKKQLAGGKAGPGLISAAANGDLVFAMAMNAYDPDMLDQILGLSKPENSLEDSDKLKKIRKEWGYGDELASYVDFKLIVDAITGGDSLAARQVQALDAAEGNISVLSSEPCQSEFRNIAENWPMMVGGNRAFEVTDDSVKFDGHFALLMENEPLRNTLQLLRGAVPVSQSNSEALVSLGLGLNVDTAPQLAAQLTDIVTGLRFECEGLQEINQLAEFDISTLSMGAMMFSGMARGVKGISFNVYDGDLDMEGQIPVKGIDSAIAIAAEDPVTLLQTLRMLPQMGMLADMPTDGTPISLNEFIPVPVPDGAEIFAAVKGKNIVIYSGEEAEDFANRLEASGDKGLLFMSLNTLKLWDKMNEIVEQMPEQMRRDGEVADILTAMEAYPVGRLSYKMDFTDKGFEVESVSQINRPEQ